MEPENVRQVAVIGAGVMGHGIAQVFANAGIDVNLVDVRQEILDRALQLVKGNLKTLADCGKLRIEEMPAILNRIHPLTDLSAAAKGADFVLEAVAEIPEVKNKIFKRLEAVCPSKCVLASNTSGLEIFKIVKLKDPSRAVIAHWFAPPHIIPLVEVVPGPNTSPEVLHFTAELMKRIGKRPLVMKQFVQRFIVNRLQNAIVFAALEILNNGWATAEEIDLALKLSLGIRMPVVGVVQSLDFTGLNLVFEIFKSVGLKVPLIEEKVKRGHVGVSTSKGIYDYGSRNEEEILRHRDMLYLKMLDHLENIGAFNPL